MALNNAVKDASENGGQQGKDGLADEDANLMIKLKFLTYKVFFSLEGLLGFVAFCYLFRYIIIMMLHMSSIL